jgi:signal transduction histidine kinase
MRQLNNIVEDILNTSRIEQGRLTLNYEDTEVVGIVKEILVELGTKAKNKGLVLLNEIPNRASIVANIDKNKIYEVIVNLVDNSISYTPNGSVSVGIENKRNSFVIKVKDTGIGIPNKQKKLLFQRFSRLENAKRIRPDGSGIGLFTAKTIVDMHGGRIWFTSRINRGTTFYVELPKRLSNKPSVKQS